MKGLNPEESFLPFQTAKTKFIPYRDAGSGPSVYNLNAIDILRGLYKGKNFGWIDFDTFNYREYEYFEQVYFLLN